MQGHDTRDWSDLAACRDIETDLFFPVGDSGPALRQVEQAKAVCARCPVIQECLTVALRTGQEHGIWGGETAEERRATRRRRNRARRVVATDTAPARATAVAS